MGKYFWFLSFFIFSCSSREPKSPEFISRELTEFITDTLYFEKDEFTKNLPTKFSFFEKSDSSLLYCWSANRLLQYAYPSGKLISSTNFFAEGPDGIGAYISGTLITDDGLFFISDQKEIVQTDLGGKVVRRYPLPVVPGERLGANFSTMNGNEMSYNTESKVLVLADVPFVLKAANMSYRDWLWKLDTRTGNFVTVGFGYPEIYKEYYDDPELGVFSHTYLEDKGLFVISFAANDSLLLLDTDQTLWVDGGSTRSLTFQKGKTEPRGEWTVFLPSMETSRYKRTQFDPYRKRFWRYVDIQTYKLEEDKFKNESSFIMLDQDFKKVAELFFDNRKILPTGFSTPNGFYLKLAGQDSDDREAYLRIQL
ncbi:MAG: DUF4221 family protein [Rhodonellum sp.]|nr:DUF4221 family protein [Rhodonellum sp.]